MLTFKPMRASRGTFIVKLNGVTVGVVKQQGDQWCPFTTDAKWTGARFSSRQAAADSLLVQS